MSRQLRHHLHCMIGLQPGLTWLPAMGAVFHTARVPPEAWQRIFAVGVIVYPLVGLKKLLTAR